MMGTSAMSVSMIVIDADIPFVERSPGPSMRSNILSKFEHVVVGNVPRDSRKQKGRSLVYVLVFYHNTLQCDRIEDIKCGSLQLISQRRGGRGEKARTPNNVENRKTEPYVSANVLW